MWDDSDCNHLCVCVCVFLNICQLLLIYSVSKLTKDKSGDRLKRTLSGFISYSRTRAVPVLQYRSPRRSYMPMFLIYLQHSILANLLTLLEDAMV